MPSSAGLLAVATPSSAYLESVEAQLRAVIAEQRGSATSQQLDDVWSEIAEVVQGGKRTRPMLVHLAHQAFGGTQEGPAVEVGCAFELLHTGLLIHDDVIDRDFFRRGRPTLSATYRDAALQRGQSCSEAAHSGNSAAVIAGDLLISQAVRLLYHAVKAAPSEQAITECFHQAIGDAAAGELTDLMLADGIAADGIEEILQMHRLKTATYSFEAPLRIGALLAGARAPQAEDIAILGTHLGIGYQILDDILGTFGATQLTGKSNESDLREGKQTVLMAIAERDPELAPHLRQWRTGQLSHQQLRAEFITRGVEDQARSLLHQHRARSHELLNQLPITEMGREPLRAVITNTLTRSA